MSKNTPKTAGQRARLAAKKRGRLQISSALPAIVGAAAKAAAEGLFSVDVALEDPWFLDKTNQRDLRRILKQQDLYAVNPRVEDGRFVLSVAWGDFPPQESLFRPKAVALALPVILVVNGTSQVGRAALAELAEYRGLYTVRATSRSEPASDVAEALSHVEWVKSDLSKESLTEVTKGVHKVFYVMPPSENRVEAARNLSAAAAANGVQYVVDISVVGADYRAIKFANQAKDQEEAIEASGIPFTHLRCTGFLENFLSLAEGIKQQDTFAYPLGTSAMPMVAVADVGRAAARLLTRMGAEGVTVDLTGAEPLTGTDIAAALSELTGREIKYTSPELQGWVSQLKSYDVPGWMADGMGELMGVVQKGMAAEASPDGPKLLGHMTSLKEWLNENKSSFN